MKDQDTVRGLSILVNNFAVQVSRLVELMQVGGDVCDQAACAKKAGDLVAGGIQEAQPTLRKLARKARGS